MKLICVEKCYDSANRKAFGAGEIADFDGPELERLTRLGFFKRFVLPDSGADALQAILQIHPEWAPVKPKPIGAVATGASTVSSDELMQKAQAIGVGIVKEATERAEAMIADAQAKASELYNQAAARAGELCNQAAAKATELYNQAVAKAEAILEQAVADLKPRQ